MCDSGRGSGGRVNWNNLQFDNLFGGWSSETFFITFHLQLHFYSCKYKFHSVLVTKCCISPSFLLSWTPATWSLSFCYYRWPSPLIVTLVMTNNIFAYVLWSRENELWVSIRVWKGFALISISRWLEGSYAEHWNHGQHCQLSW